MTPDKDVLLFAYGLMIVVISFMGFLTENIWLAITKGYVDNRNMHAPFLLGYGVLILMMYLGLGTPRELAAWGFLKYIPEGLPSYIFYYVVSFFIVSIGEIALGTLVEKLCKIQYWNYNWLPLHFTQYTSVPTSIMFAAIITFVMSNLYTPILNSILQMDVSRMKFLSIVLMGILVLDFICSFRTMYRKQDFNDIWRYDLKYAQQKRRDEMECSSSSLSLPESH